MSLAVKIDKTGVLYISRAGRFVEQLCPYGESKNCSHHCPQFGEPFYVADKKCWNMILCGRFVIMFEQFLDERQNPNNESPGLDN